MPVHSYTSNSKGSHALLKLLAAALLVTICFWSLSPRYAAVAEKNTVNVLTQQRFDEFYALPTNSLDMVFVGSSHAYCTFDPHRIDPALGLSSFQMGTPLQHPDTTYYSLLEIYKTQKPKYVVMELYWDMLDEGFDLQQANAFFEVLKDPDLKKAYIKDVFPLSDKLKYHLLPIRYQQAYFAYEGGEMDKALQKRFDLTPKQAPRAPGEEYYAGKGFLYSNQTMLPSEYNTTNQFRHVDGRQFHINDKQKHYLDEIVRLCRENGSQLIFITAPIAKVSLDYISHYDAIHKQLAQLASSYGVPYLDCNTEPTLQKSLTNDHFRDDAHLNDSGVTLVSPIIIDWLQKQGL